MKKCELYDSKNQYEYEYIERNVDKLGEELSRFLTKYIKEKNENRRNKYKFSSEEIIISSISVGLLIFSMKFCDGKKCNKISQCIKSFIEESIKTFPGEEFDESNNKSKN